MTAVNVSSSNSTYCSVDGVLFSKDKKTLIYFPNGRTGEYTIPSGVKILNSNSFYGCNLTSVKIPEGVTSLTSGTFGASDSLASLYIPVSVTSIAGSAAPLTLKDIYYAGSKADWSKITITGLGFSEQYSVIHYAVTRVPGDVNNDGKVTTMDATLIKRYIVGGYSIPVFNKENADVNGDGKVTTMDATLIKRYIVGGYGVVLK